MSQAKSRSSSAIGADLRWLKATAKSFVQIAEIALTVRI